MFKKTAIPKTFSDFGIDLGGRWGGEINTICPQCSPNRKKNKAKCLSVNTDKGVWHCNHPECGWSGSLQSGEEGKFPDTNYKRPKRKPSYTYEDGEAVFLNQWFQARGISPATIDRHKISLRSVFMPQTESELNCIAFPYFSGGDCLNVKYRALEEKCFRQEAGAEKILYGLDDMQTGEGSVVIVVEGEIDKLSCEEAGVKSAISVPDGAPDVKAKSYSSKFSFLDYSFEALEQVERFVLAVDNDPPGKHLEAELARRFGHERCWVVEWPEGCKDANEVLVTLGPEALRQCLEEAKPFPLEGIVEALDLAGEVATLYEQGLPGGVSTGWPAVDELFTAKKGHLVIVTGIPGHGKSEWLDNLMVNLSRLYGWRHAVFSAENAPVARHIAKLIEKHSGFPFREGPNDRLSLADVMLELQWVHDHFFFLDTPEDDVTPEAVLKLARQLVKRYGVDLLIVDPWNELDLKGDRGETETQAIGRTLTAFRRFARANNVLTVIVAHPMKLKRKDDGSYPVPGPYDINGSAHFRNRADDCLCIWRDVQSDSREVLFLSQKSRFREVGRVGQTKLIWEPKTGSYSEPGVSRLLAYPKR
ncbi:MAG: toprim domain-containing protein [Nitrospirales bacterium]|nr:toprim domain-containing protein [Nitrospirales bacterium]